MSPVVLDVLAAVAPVQAFTAARGGAVLAGVHLTARKRTVALSEAGSQIASAALACSRAGHPYAPLLWGGVRWTVVIATIDTPLIDTYRGY